jgi:hypothetical protein
VTPPAFDDPFGDDPFGTAAIRRRVLDAWAASPARFREDANAEEDLALGAYRDRVVVELAQNAADAAARTGRGGRLLLRLDGGERPVLVAANTGAPLDAAGVEALATLRASAKRDASTVGRFGVGFSAVLGVSDEPAVVGRAGGVRFSRATTQALLADVPALTAELGARGGHVPVLRLPFPAAPPPGLPPEGFDTAVLLPVRDADAVQALRGQLEALDDGVLLALPALAELRVELPGAPARVLADVGRRWRVWRRAGVLDPASLADRPTEERARPSWSVTWALPRDGAARPARVLHAPTPSDEPLAWPALLVATFPLDPGRRHVAPGPATDALVAQAAAAYADLLAELAAEPAGVAEPWRLVPTGLPAGTLDGALRAALRERLPGTPLLHSAEDPAVVLRPRNAVALEAPAGADPDAVRALAGVVAGLVEAPRDAAGAFDVLGVRRLALADVVDQLPVPADDGGWRRLYSGLAALADDASLREVLAALPVPLADGRVVRGVRGVVLPPADTDVAGALATLGVRALDPQVAGDDRARRLLERLGAVAVPGRRALELPAVAAAVAALSDDEAHVGPELVDAVLTLVAAAAREGLEAGDLPWLGGLPLPDTDGELAPAADLVLPGSLAERLLDPDAVGVVATAVVERWGPATLRAAGVLDGLGVVRAWDVPLDAPPDDTLDGALDAVAGWLEALADVADAAFGSSLGAVVAEVTGVRDLDAVRDDAWPEVLDLLARDRALRAALLTPARVVAPTGASAAGTSYTAWWLREQLAGGGAWADPEAPPGLAALLPAPPPELEGADAAVRAALGAVREPASLDPAAVADVLDGLADPEVELDAATALRVWRALAAVLAERPPDVAGSPPPSRVRVLDAGGGTAVVDADHACVVGDPMHVQRQDLGPFVVAPGARPAAALADLLDLPLAADLARGEIAEGGEEAGRLADVPPAVAAVLPDAGRRWCEHELLRVDGVEVDWWVDASGFVHASTLDGLSRGLAFAAGAWPLRAALAEVLLDPGALPAVLLDEAFGTLGEAGQPRP